MLRYQDPPYDLLLRSTVISWHEHMRLLPCGGLDEKYCDHFAASCDAVGIDMACCSIPLPRFGCSMEDCIQANNAVYQAMQRHPGKILGMAFVHPGYGAAALDEVRRCVEELGMVGVKLYHHYKMSDPVQWPLLELCIDLDIPLLMHAGKPTDAATCARQPRISSGPHFAEASRRYPEARLICAHIGGGGDWHWTLKALQDVPGVVIDMSGSSYDCPMIEESVRYLGANRILFGTDNSFCSCIGKMLGADISAEEKKTILEGSDFLRFIKRGCNA